MSQNAPGKDALDYRVGTHSRFLAAMLAALRHQPALRGLGTVETGDPVVALADVWSASLDVLTFYTERIANEGYLRTATERGAVLALARQIGRELGPGVAASTWLAFTLDEPPPPLPPGSDLATRAPHASIVAPATVIPAGTAAQTVPRPGELPMTFETVAEIEGRPGLERAAGPVHRAVPARLRRHFAAAGGHHDRPDARRLAAAGRPGAAGVRARSGGIPAWWPG